MVEQNEGRTDFEKLSQLERNHAAAYRQGSMVQAIKDLFTKPYRFCYVSERGYPGGLRTIYASFTLGKATETFFYGFNPDGSLRSLHVTKELYGSCNPVFELKLVRDVPVLDGAGNQVKDRNGNPIFRFWGRISDKKDLPKWKKTFKEPDWYGHSSEITIPDAHK